MVAVLLHLFLGLLRTLESEVLQPSQHPPSRVDGAHQLVGAAETDVECQVLCILLWLLRVDIPRGTLQPADHLQPSTGAELGI